MTELEASEKMSQFLRLTFYILVSKSQIGLFKVLFRLNKCMISWNFISKDLSKNVEHHFHSINKVNATFFSRNKMRFFTLKGDNV